MGGAARGTVGPAKSGTLIPLGCRTIECRAVSEHARIQSYAHAIEKSCRTAMIRLRRR